MAGAAITKVGYIGMGIMGAAMAANLRKAGYELIVWNRTQAKCDALKQQGATVAASPAEVAAQGAQVIFTNVTDTPDVEAVLLGEDGVASSAKAGAIVVDNSTINPVATKAIAARLAERGIIFFDAPVSGGDVGARNATLSIMVGGPAEHFATIEPLLKAMGKSVTLLGEAGLGQTCKACNQIAVSLSLLGTCEALALAQQSGLDLDKMIQVVSAGAGGSWQLANLGPKIAQGNFNPGFTIDLVLKDLNIVMNTGRELQLPLAGLALAETYFRAAQANGGGKLGTQAMAQVLEKLGGFTFAK